jgi:hypothetical protein
MGHPVGRRAPTRSSPVTRPIWILALKMSDIRIAHPNGAKKTK